MKTTGFRLLFSSDTPGQASLEFDTKFRSSATMSNSASSDHVSEISAGNLADLVSRVLRIASNTSSQAHRSPAERSRS
jgi:hypothetical protein